MATAAVVFRKDKLNKRNKGPIHFRIINHRKVKYISSKVMIHIDEWDFKQKKVKPKHKNSSRLNAMLTKKLTQILNELYEHEQNNKEIHVEKFRREIRVAKPIDFFEYAQKDLDEYLRNDQVSTHDKNRSVVRKLQAFNNNKALYFHEITKEFLTDYEIHLRNLDRPNSTNTILKDMKYIKKLVNKAIGEGKIKFENNPFNTYKLKAAKTSRVFLTKEELKLIEDFKATPGTKLDLHKDMFVFACYAGGIRISDLLKVKWKDYDGDRIYITMKKTGEPIAIKIIEKTRLILEKYQTIYRGKNDFIFPMLPDNLNLKDARALDTAISRATAYTNKNLKIIEQKIGLSKHISFHISRHTFATLALTLDIPMEMIAKILGHTSLKEVQVYAKIASNQLDNALDKFSVLN